MAGVQFSVGLDTVVAETLLSRLAAFGQDETSLMDQIGRALVTGAAERIASTNVSPDGAAWEPSKRVVETGGRTLYLSGALERGINHWAASDHVLVGSNTPYAAVHQLGAAVGSLGVWVGNDKNGRSMTVLSPWGDIPARPFLGVSDEEAEEITDFVVLRLDDLIGNLQ